MPRKTINFLICLGLAALAIWVAIPRAGASTLLVERIIARINNKIITQRQYDKERDKLHAQLAQQYSGQKLDQEFNDRSKNLLRDMIDSDLMVQKANDDDINVDTDVIKRLDEIRQQYNLKSLQALQDAVEKDGMNWEDFKDQIKRQLLMQQVISREVGSRIILTRADAQKYFDAHKKEFDSPPGVHLAEIMVSTEKHTPAEAEKLAKKAQTEIQNGARFSDVAKELSDSPSAKEGGDVGFFKQGTISEAIAADITKVDVGDVTPIIKTQYGYMIFKVLEKRTGQHPTFDQVSNQVMNYLYDQRVQGAMRGFLTQLRNESSIRLAPGFTDTGAPAGGDQSD
ncbi:MAG TPA: peptidyl-prolyl cis-trans isomerase [Terriglobia bacterium]|nr:peptidyl-prolyl cis-trans isomerase [Terriglobia bacterium]